MDPLSVTASVVTLAATVFQLSKSLHDTVSSFQSNSKVIRELKQEVNDLEEVLQVLREVGTEYEPQLASLKQPLCHCGKVCKEFDDILLDCAKHSNGPRTSFRDWARVQYMGGDIAKFKDVLAGYKATISIALAGATFHTVSITAKALDEYKELVQNAQSDLQEHLQELNEKLDALSARGTQTDGNISSERQRIEEEKESTTQCLRICEQASEYIDRLGPGLQAQQQRATSSGNPPNQSPTSLFNSSSAMSKTLLMLMECKAKVASQSTALRIRLAELEEKLQTFSDEPNRGPASAHDRERNQLLEERESITQCLTICDDASNQAQNARTNVIEDVTSADDSSQVIVSTVGDLIRAKRVTTGSRSAQWFGQMSDETVQTLSHVYGKSSVEQPEVSVEKPTLVKGENAEEFRKRFGAGRHLSTEELVVRT